MALGWIKMTVNLWVRYFIPTSVIFLRLTTVSTHSCAWLAWTCLEQGLSPNYLTQLKPKDINQETGNIRLLFDLSHIDSWFTCDLIFGSGLWHFTWMSVFALSTGELGSAGRNVQSLSQRLVSPEHNTLLLSRRVELWIIFRGVPTSVQILAHISWW